MAAVTQFIQSIKESINLALERGPTPSSFYWASNSPVTVCWSITVIKMTGFTCVYVCVCVCWTDITWLGPLQPVPVFSPLVGLLQDSQPPPATAAYRDEVLPPPLLGRPARGLWPPAGPPHHRVCRDALRRTWWVDYTIIITTSNISCTSSINELPGCLGCTT